MRPISRKVQGDGEVFETHYGDKIITFGVPLGSFELSDIMILNAEEAGISADDPDYNDVLQNLATFAWSMRHPMRAELFVSPQLLPALLDNNFDGLDDTTKHRVKQWSIKARESNHDLFFTDGGSDQDTICEVLSLPTQCRRILAHFNLTYKLDPSQW